jgi:hypothetical protein
MFAKLSSRWSTTVLALILLSASVRALGQTVLDFEDRPTGTTINTQYAGQGPIFTDAYLETDPAAHSGTRVLRQTKPGSEIFVIVPMVIQWNSPQSRVKLFAGHQYDSENGTLKAFDSNGNVVASDGPRLVPQNTFTTAFEVTVSTPSIVRVEFQLVNSSFASIDDLEFHGDPAPPLPTDPPVVHLIQPVDGINVDIPNDIPLLDIAGTVTGDGLPPNVTVTVGFKRPPESANLPPLTLVLQLIGTGTTRQFTLPGGMTPLPLGPIVVTATVENIAGLKGTATSNLTNFPKAVRDRFFTEGGTAVFGEFQYGVLGACAIAIYEHGAISGQNGGAIVIRGDIFTKWLTLRGPFNEPGWFGCPSNEEGDTVLWGARSQPFERGRIYTRLPTAAPPAAFYVPAVFTNAIDRRGGDPGIGLPLGDPTDSVGPMQTWLFQQFARPGDDVSFAPSTMEIRGTPPTLWMERQAGPWLLGQPDAPDQERMGGSMGSHTFERTDLDKATQKSYATIWEGFDCGQGNNLGPCPVLGDVSFPPEITPQNQPDFKNQFCSGGTYLPGFSDPPEWKSIRGQYDATPVSGVVNEAHMADVDNGLTHRTHNATCPYDSEELGALFEGILGAELVNVGSLVCASDFEFFVRPIGPQIVTTPQLPSLFGGSNKTVIKTEYEEAYAAMAHNFLGTPRVGDLLHMTGRWIVDCGHATYKTELHPIFSFARANTVFTETNPFTGLEDPLFGAKPATRVAIWINGWYPGGDGNAIEYDIFPPPRPSPNALLHVVKPVDSGSGNYQAAQDVTLNFSLDPAGSATKVHLRFTATRRENPVTQEGEMLFEPGRQYWGIWYLYWGD